MPLHLKPSAQAGIQGNPIFDPIGTNEYIKTELLKRGWEKNIPIPKQYNFLGTDVDFGKLGLIGESQFSNYPFLLNNTIRAELFFKAKIKFGGQNTKLVFIITKAQMFPASNSTLYYEQAIKQLKALAEYGVFDVPIRVLGLFEQVDKTVPVKWTLYGRERSRIVTHQEDIQCQISSKNKVSNRCVIRLM
ncbi:restriction endonuclease [Planktothricoides sp. SR001]|uniref:restriction endonuclease n=1 Tax=Planktothricoides sp. SR001 TaxID=1705388 RepID=UPI0006C898DA|nr:restriction endonuclease [Planktothricoides sp. SR001]